MRATATDQPPVAAPTLDDCVLLPAAEYPVGEPGEERVAEVGPVLVGRYSVTNAWVARWLGPVTPRLAAPLLADHPAVGITHADALAFCAWASAELGRGVRLLSGDEWEAAARGPEARTWPWGPSFAPGRCACAESGWGATAPVGAHPSGASWIGAEQLAGNVWEWVGDAGADGWVTVRGGSFLDHEWGLRASRALDAQPGRATDTTGFRIAIEVRRFE